MIARLMTIALGLVATSTAMAASTDDDWLPNSFRLGYYYVKYYTHADDITGPYVPAGANLRLKDVYTPYFAYVRSLNNHFSVELATGVPPLTKTVGKGPAELGSVPFNGQVIATARWFAPTLLFEYNFLDASSPLRPYIGAGINYVSFYSRQVTAAGNAVAGGPTSLSLPQSVGPAGTIGVSYRIARRFSLYVSYSASEVDSRAALNTAGVIRTSHIAFGPRALVLSAGYNF
jgi:outer membrane protein